MKKWSTCIQINFPRSSHIICSNSIKIYNPCHGSYSASKAALEALSECLAGEVANFGIRVAIVEPGVINTPINTKQKYRKVESVYPAHARMEAYMQASASDNVMPSEVAETVLAIANGEKTSFRNTVGADAKQILRWRASLSDEQWIAKSSESEKTWIRRMNLLGLDVKSSV